MKKLEYRVIELRMCRQGMRWYVELTLLALGQLKVYRFTIGDKKQLLPEIVARAADLVSRVTA